MQKVGQDTPEKLTVPPADVRTLRARLILEEALETIHAMGVTVRAGGLSGPVIEERHLHFDVTDDVDPVEVADGCAEISVVTIGTLISFGIDDEPLLEEVDASNLRKFEPGSYRRDDGKWIKPPGWTPPDIRGAMERGYGT